MALVEELRDDLQRAHSQAIDREVGHKKAIAHVLSKLGEAEEREARLQESVTSLQARLESTKKSLLDKLGSFSAGAGSSAAPRSSSGRGRRKPGKKATTTSSENWGERLSEEDRGSRSSEDDGQEEGSNDSRQGPPSSRPRHDDGTTSTTRGRTRSKSSAPSLARRIARHSRSRSRARPPHSRSPSRARPTPLQFGWDSDTADKEDASWKLVSSFRPGQKKAVFYIGNLPSSTEAESLTEFVERRAAEVGLAHKPKVFNCKVFKKPDATDARTLCGARMTVLCTDGGVIGSPSFWPRPVYVREWHFNGPSDAGAHRPPGDTPTNRTRLAADAPSATLSQGGDGADNVS